MSDVKKPEFVAGELRHQSRKHKDGQGFPSAAGELMIRAADRIEQLEAQLRDSQEREARLREGLGKIASEWKEKHAKAEVEWEGCGTEAFGDPVFMEAITMKPMCFLAKKLLKGNSNGE